MRYKLMSVLFISLFLKQCGGQSYNWTNYQALSSPVDRPWIIIKCNFSDVPAIPPGLDDRIQNFLAPGVLGLGSMADYYHDVSYGAVSVLNNKVYGWFSAPYSFQGMSNFVKQYGSQSRYQMIVQCLNQVPQNLKIDFTKYYGAIVVTNQYPSDEGAIGAGQYKVTINNQQPTIALVLLNPTVLNTLVTGHEMGHGFGLQHSRDSIPDNCGGSPGAYCDPWDVMSTARAFSFVGTNFPNFPTPGGLSDGPGLNVPNLLHQGWIPANRIQTYATGAPTTSVTLAALSHPEVQSALTVELYAGNPADYYTIEYRQPDGWDAGIPTATVLIHEFKSGALYSYLQRNFVNGSIPCQLQPQQCEFFQGMTWTDPANQFSVLVQAINPSAGTATVQISTPGPPRPDPAPVPSTGGSSE